MKIKEVFFASPYHTWPVKFSKDTKSNPPRTHTVYVIGTGNIAGTQLVYWCTDPLPALSITVSTELGFFEVFGDYEQVALSDEEHDQFIRIGGQ